MEIFSIVRIQRVRGTCELAGLRELRFEGVTQGIFAALDTFWKPLDPEARVPTDGNIGNV